MGPTEFEAWPLSEDLRVGTRTFKVTAWNAHEAAERYVRDHVDYNNPIDWLFLGESFPVFIREPLTGRQTRYLVTRTVNYSVSPPAVA
jgi:hypothetical protein